MQSSSGENVRYRRESAAEFCSEGLFQFKHPAFVASSTAAAAPLSLSLPPSISISLRLPGSEVKWAGGLRSMLRWEVSSFRKVTPVIFLPKLTLRLTDHFLHFQFGKFTFLRSAD